MVSLRFLLDTNAISEPLKPIPNEAFLRRFRTHGAEMAVSVTTWHEALFGMYRLPEGRKRSQVRDYLFDVIAATLSILPYDAAAAQWHAEERARQGAKGRNAPFADGQVAAVARMHNLTVVTANVKDFQFFSKLSVENWLA